jgi:WD40 repeat protein
LEVLPNGYLAYVGANKIIRFLNYEKDFYDVSNIDKTFIITGQSRSQLRLLSHNRLASASEDKTLKIWNITSNTLIQSIDINPAIINSEGNFIALSDDLVAGAWYYQSIIQIWNLTDYKLVKEIDFQDKIIMSLTSLLNKYLVVGFTDNYINILNINNDYLLTNEIKLDSTPLELAYLPNKDLIAITSIGNIYVLDLINNQIKRNFSTEINKLESLEVINDKYIAVGHRGYLTIYDLINQELVFKNDFFISNNGEHIYSMKFIKNGNYLVNTHSKGQNNLFVWKIFFK